MPANDRIILDTILRQKREEITPDVSEPDYFEIFTAEQILKDFDLSYDEIEAGIIGSGGDGGIDSIYLFVNGELVLEDTDLSSFKKDIVIDLIFIQSKTSQTFSESTIDKLIASTGELLDLSRGIEDLKSVYNSDLLDIIGRFRDTYDQLGAKFPTLRLSYYYATRGDEPHPNVARKVEKLAGTVKQLFSSVECSFHFLGSGHLLELARRAPQTSFQIELAESPVSAAGAVAYVCLVQLRSYYDFITDDVGKLKRAIFESNVRDYQGDVQVNEGISQTLNNKGGKEDFWWLNNGITVVATKATWSGKTMTVENPQIVNGLQTSTEIYKYFEQSNTVGEKRNVLVRVIVPPEPESWDRIIKATNSQTKIPDASLRATEKIHRNIEEYLRPHGLFYDRRKNFYKNEGKPKEKIISITYLAQAVMATALGRPDSARGRPSSLLKGEEDYKRVFNPDYPLELYLKCTRLLKNVERFVKSDSADLDSKERINLKFHLAMFTAISILGKTNPQPTEIAASNIDKIDDALLQESLVIVRDAYRALGETDQAAKGQQLPEMLKKKLSENGAPGPTTN